MTTALLLATTLISVSGQGTKTYTNKDLNISFEHPRTWEMTKEKDSFIFSIPVEGWPTKAELRITSVHFFSDEQTWEEVQASRARGSREEVERQWREVMLGVPLLICKTKYKQGEVDRVRTMSLMYAWGPHKPLFNLDAEAPVFDRAEEQVRQVFSTLKTANGVMPKPEDPTKPYDGPPIGGSGVVRPPLVMGPQAPSEPVKAPLALQAKTAGLEVILRVPEGWTSEKVADDKYKLSHPKLSGPVTVTVASSLDSDRAERALVKASYAKGNQFKTVDKREDKRIRRTSAGNVAWFTYRIGTGEQGTLATLDAAGELREFYWLLEGRWNSDATFRGDMKVLESLIDVMSVEVVQ